MKLIKLFDRDYDFQLKNMEKTTNYKAEKSCYSEANYGVLFRNLNTARESMMTFGLRFTSYLVYASGCLFHETRINE